jgi:hypothetical protein
MCLENEKQDKCRSFGHPVIHLAKKASWADYNGEISEAVSFYRVQFIKCCLMGRKGSGVTISLWMGYKFINKTVYVPKRRATFD